MGAHPCFFDIFKVTAQGWGGAPKKKPYDPPPLPPPEPRQWGAKKILIERNGYSQVFKIDAGRQVHTIASTIAEEARLENPTAWLLCKANDELVSDTTDIFDGQTYRLRSTVRMEHEGRTKCFNMYEEDDPTALHHRIHRELGAGPDRWDLLDIRGTVIAQGARIAAGTRVFEVELTEPIQRHEGPKFVRLNYRWQKSTIPVRADDAMTDMCLLIETLFRLQRGGQATEQDYAALLELPVAGISDCKSDPEILREPSSKRRILEDGIRKACNRTQWDGQDDNVVEQWKKFQRDWTQIISQISEGRIELTGMKGSDGGSLGRKSAQRNKQGHVRKKKQKGLIRAIKQE
jgi:hypothetical protein